MNASESDRCLDLQVVAAFVEGTLEGEQLAATIRHLRHCRSCRSIAAGAIALDVPEKQPATLWIPALASAAAVAVLIAGLFWFQAARRPAHPDPFAQMVSSAPKASRMLEPRLAGFGWAPYRNMMADRQNTTDEKLKARGTAGRVLRELKNDQSARALHAKAVANLLRDNIAEAISLLRACSTLTPQDSHVWNDLGAALYVHAQSENELLEALNASRKSIQLDPGMAEPYFNVALILERISAKPEKIRAAWIEYLRHDSTSEWAEEARNHLAVYRERN